MYKMRRACMHYWANVMHKSSMIDTLLPIQNMVVETECDDFISWLPSRAPTSIVVKKRRICSIYTPRGYKRDVSPRDCSQSNVSATFRVYVAVCRMHKGSPFKYAGMKFNPQHPFPARLCLVSTIDTTSGCDRCEEQRSCACMVFFF